jgi:hypothetical protein
MHPITGFTTTENRLVNDDSYTYDIDWVDEGGTVGRIARLQGGFYQGFYKLQGYDYEVYPTRNALGWTAEFLLKYRWTGDTSVGLNDRYPDGKVPSFIWVLVLKINFITTPTVIQNKIRDTQE